jgi:hypothetical protein
VFTSTVTVVASTPNTALPKTFFSIVVIYLLNVRNVFVKIPLENNSKGIIVGLVFMKAS